MSEQEKEPKLIIDEDWKTQVEREKAEAEAEAEAKAANTDAVPASDAAAVEPSTDVKPVETKPVETKPADKKSPAESVAQMPPATFDFLVTMLATQAMHALGQIPGPDGKPAELDKPLAKHYIDLLAVIETKTAGNLDASEKKMLEEILHSLRMMFVQVK